MKFCLCEKPSQAVDIAAVLGGRVKPTTEKNSATKSGATRSAVGQRPKTRRVR